MLDFIKLAATYHIPTKTSGHPHCRANWTQAQCPQCGEGGSHGGWYLGWNNELGFFHCWRCGPMRVWEVLKGLLRTNDNRTVKAAIAAHQRGGYAPLAPVQKARPRTLKPPTGAEAMGGAHRAYLRGRGYNPEVLEAEWGLLGTTMHSADWNWRVVYPVANAAGRVVAWQGRSIGEAEKRYLFTEDAKCLEDPRLLLYGYDKIPGDSVLVVEGVTGVWRFGPGTVATFGIDWKPDHVHLLRRVPNRYILFDPEPKAQQRARQLARNLAVFGGNTEIISGFPCDPGMLSTRVAQRVIKELGIAG